MSTENALPEYVTPQEVAAMLRLSVKSVYRMAAADLTMPQLRFGGSLRFPRERLLRWLRDREGACASRRRPARLRSAVNA